MARSEAGALMEARHTSQELRALGLTQQRLVVNGVFLATLVDDPMAQAMQAKGEQALAEMPAASRELPTDWVPLMAIDSMGLPAWRALLSGAPSAGPLLVATVPNRSGLPGVRFGLKAFCGALGAAAPGGVQALRCLLMK